MKSQSKPWFKIGHSSGKQYYKRCRNMLIKDVQISQHRHLPINRIVIHLLAQYTELINKAKARSILRRIGYFKKNLSCFYIVVALWEVVPTFLKCPFILYSYLFTCKIAVIKFLQSGRSYTCCFHLAQEHCWPSPEFFAHMLFMSPKLSFYAVNFLSSYISFHFHEEKVDLARKFKQKCGGSIKSLKSFETLWSFDY